MWCVLSQTTHTQERIRKGYFIWHQHDVSHIFTVWRVDLSRQDSISNHEHDFVTALNFCHAEYCVNTLKYKSRRKLVGKVLWTGTLLWPWTPSTFSLLFCHYLSLLVVGLWTLGRRTERGCQWTKLKKQIHTPTRNGVWVAVTITPELCIYKYIQLVVKFKTISTHI